MSSGRLVANPLTYTVVVSYPSGSRKTWWRSLSANRLILSSIDGQYRGPTALILPVNMGDRSNPFRRTSWVFGLVCVRYIGIRLFVILSVWNENGLGGLSLPCSSALVRSIV